MKILIIGASGFIGSNIMVRISKKHQVFGTYLTNLHVKPLGKNLIQLDVRDEKAVLETINKVNPNLIIQVCGTKNIEFCEDNPNESERIHVKGTINVTNASKKSDIRIAYISSDCVFDGEKNLFFEGDRTNAFNTYGKVKRNAEEYIQELIPNHIIIRLSLAFGWRRKGQADNFALKTIRSLKSGQSFRAATNLFNTPIEIEPAAEAIIRLSTCSDKGVFHLAGNERVSRYEFARTVSDIMGFNSSFIKPVLDNSGLRQPNSCLSVSKVEEKLKCKIESFRLGVDRMKNQISTLTKAI